MKKTFIDTVDGLINIDHIVKISTSYVKSNGWTIAFYLTGDHRMQIYFEEEKDFDHAFAEIKKAISTVRI